MLDEHEESKSTPHTKTHNEDKVIPSATDTLAEISFAILLLGSIVLCPFLLVIVAVNIESKRQGKKTVKEE